MRFFKFLVACLITASLLLMAALFYFYHWLSTPVALTHAEQLFVVRSGESVQAVAKRLHAQNNLRWPLVWRLYARFVDDAPIRRGEYQWSEPKLSPLAMLDKMQEGRVVKYQLTLVEGLTYKDYMQALHQHPKLVRLLSDTSPETVVVRVGIEAEHPEGWFYPDTYQFIAGDTDLSILRRSHLRMRQVLMEQWALKGEGLPYNSPYDALIMASIIEKETGAVDEREQIAGVFVRRLQKRMRLQTDPTVIYGLGDRYDGNLTRNHLRETTLYNTYRIHGLPPTPIANPGGAAIHAAMHPAHGDALYFVAKGDGSHVFSETLEAHNRAVNRFQRFQRAEQYRSAPK